MGGEDGVEEEEREEGVERDPHGGKVKSVEVLLERWRWKRRRRRRRGNDVGSQTLGVSHSRQFPFPDNRRLSDQKKTCIVIDYNRLIFR